MKIQPTAFGPQSAGFLQQPIERSVLLPSHPADRLADQFAHRNSGRLRASWVPTATHLIRPYAFDVMPAIFENPVCEVVAIAAERTFWEKATILHQEAYRETQMPQHYSRHYYDLYKLAVSRVRASALADPTLLQDVVAFKRRFYPSAWARYELAVPGSLKLLPATPSHVKDLAHDYEGMQVMLFGAPPEFRDILDELAQLEAEINTTATKTT